MRYERCTIAHTTYHSFTWFLRVTHTVAYATHPVAYVFARYDTNGVICEQRGQMRVKTISLNGISYVNKYDFCSVELLWLTVVFERALCTAASHQLRCWFDRQLILICSHSNAECENVLLFSNESNWVNCELVTWILCWANWNFSLFSTDCRHLYASMSVLCRHKIHSQPFSSIDRTSFHFGWESWAQLTHIAHCTRADCIVLAFVGSELFGIQRDFPVIRFVKYALREFRK